MADKRRIYRLIIVFVALSAAFIVWNLMTSATGPLIDLGYGKIAIVSTGIIIWLGMEIFHKPQDR